MKRWTMLVYMAGDNNLDKYGIRDIIEMEQVGSSDFVDVVVQFDRKHQYIVDEDRWEETRRYHIEKSDDPNKIGSPVLENLGETNCGSPETLSDFLSWGAINFPAEKYMVVIWGHGGGWKDYDGYKALPAFATSLFNHYSMMGDSTHVLSRILKPMSLNIAKFIANDDTSKDFLDTLELHSAIDKALHTTLGDSTIKYDILGFDACLMSMIEVIYQLREQAQVIVGSQTTVPSDGWSYAEIVRTLTVNSNIGPDELSRSIVHSFRASYENTNRETTVSSVTLAKVEMVSRLVNDFAAEILTHLDAVYSKLDLILKHTLRFADKDYIDLYDFASLCRTNLFVGRIPEIAHQLRDAMNHLVIESGFTSEKMKKSRGLSAYFPRQGIKGLQSETYRQLEFHSHFPKWLELLDEFTGFTGELIFDRR